MRTRLTVVYHFHKSLLLHEKSNNNAGVMKRFIIEHVRVDSYNFRRESRKVSLSLSVVCSAIPRSTQSKSLPRPLSGVASSTYNFNERLNGTQFALRLLLSSRECCRCCVDVTLALVSSQLL